jgi:predicted HTH domain antitoxin
MNQFAKKAKGVIEMSREVLLRFPVDLPEELKDEDVLRKGKEIIVLELLRKKNISQGKAAELLEIDRQALFDLMDKYDIPVISMTDKELKDELTKDIFSGEAK